MNHKNMPLLKDTYLSLLKHSIGARMFRNFYIKADKRRLDILNDGELSCAYFVSYVLKGFGWIGKIHLTVDKTEKDLIRHGWRRSSGNAMKAGSVIIWKAQELENGSHRHIGFYVGDNRAVSTSYKRKQVVVHHVTFNGKRGIEAIYWRH